MTAVEQPTLPGLQWETPRGEIPVLRQDEVDGWTYLYRIWDLDHGRVPVLLYVGVTEHLHQRLLKHSHKPWWPRYPDVTIEPYPTRDMALTAELHAIRTEHPHYNHLGMLLPFHEGDGPWSR